tara:strand:- start:2101 stop:3297 length:1197 start_codon:yes stop_codon:yes gene_type:complete
MSKSKKKIVLIANQNEIFYRLRMPWVKFLIKNNYEVFAVTPKGKWTKKIESYGATHISWEINRSSLNPFGAILSIFSLYKILRNIKPDIVQNFHTKPNIIAPIAGKLARVKINVSTITGLGYAFVDRNNIKGKVIQYVATKSYKFANKISDKVFFQNQDDLNLLTIKKAIDPKKAIFIEGGSGVDLNDYFPNNKSQNKLNYKSFRKELGIPEKNFVSIFVGRLQYDKGIKEFIEAGKKLNSKKNLSFIVVGELDHGNKKSIEKSKLNEWKKEKNIIFTGRREDVPRLLSISDVFVSPSYYREGVPRTLLEASATGLPLIGTNMPGIRDVVINNKNGLIIDIKNKDDISNAILNLSKNKKKCEDFGNMSLKFAKKKYDYKIVLNEYNKFYNSLIREKKL